MAAKQIEDDIIKRPYSKDSPRNEKDLLDLLDCVDDPLYFMKNFMKIQHAMKGSIAFDPYPYQIRMIKSFHENRNVIVMCGRQLGKSVSFKTNVLADDVNVEIGEIVTPRLSTKERIVSFLENLLIKLS